MQYNLTLDICHNIYMWGGQPNLEPYIEKLRINHPVLEMHIWFNTYWDNSYVIDETEAKMLFAKRKDMCKCDPSDRQETVTLLVRIIT